MKLGRSGKDAMQFDPRTGKWSKAEKSTRVRTAFDRNTLLQQAEVVSSEAVVKAPAAARSWLDRITGVAEIVETHTEAVVSTGNASIDWNSKKEPETTP